MLSISHMNGQIFYEIGKWSYFGHIVKHFSPFSLNFKSQGSIRTHTKTSIHSCLGGGVGSYRLENVPHFPLKSTKIH